MPVAGAGKQIYDTVVEWEGVTTHPHRFGGTEYLIGRREIGHVHGNSLVDIPFPMKVRDEIVFTHRAEPHHFLPKSGWVSFYLLKEADINRAVELMRLSFELALKQKSSGETGSRS